METPKGLRLHIALFGRRNVGKSSLLNALTGQQVSIVSDTPGTTTDPVEKTLEMAPLGPVVFLDTAGLDDAGELGELRTERSLRVMQRADVALLVTEGESWGEHEARIAALLREREIPFAVVQNKADAYPAAPGRAHGPGVLEASVSVIRGSARDGLELAEVRAALERLDRKSVV